MSREIEFLVHVGLLSMHEIAEHVSEIGETMPPSLNDFGEPVVRSLCMLAGTSRASVRAAMKSPAAKLRTTREVEGHGDRIDPYFGSFGVAYGLADEMSWHPVTVEDGTRLVNFPNVPWGRERPSGGFLPVRTLNGLAVFMNVTSVARLAVVPYGARFPEGADAVSDDDVFGFGEETAAAFAALAMETDAEEGEGVGTAAWLDRDMEDVRERFAALLSEDSGFAARMTCVAVRYADGHEEFLPVEVTECAQVASDLLNDRTGWVRIVSSGARTVLRKDVLAQVAFPMAPLPGFAHSLAAWFAEGRTEARQA